MSRLGTCRICGERFSYGDRSRTAPSSCPLHVEEWRVRQRELIERCRPWQDSEATADALLDVMPDGTPDGLATMIAAEMRRLHPETPTEVAVAMIGEFRRQVRDDPPPVAGMLMRMGVPERTAYAKAREGMRPAETLGYAIRRINRNLEAARRLREAGLEPGTLEYRRARPSAMRAAARRFP